MNEVIGKNKGFHYEWHGQRDDVVRDAALLIAYEDSCTSDDFEAKAQNVWKVVSKDAGWMSELKKHHFREFGALCGGKRNG